MSCSRGNCIISTPVVIRLYSQLVIKVNRMDMNYLIVLDVVRSGFRCGCGYQTFFVSTRSKKIILIRFSRLSWHTFHSFSILLLSSSLFLNYTTNFHRERISWCYFNLKNVTFPIFFHVFTIISTLIGLFQLKPYHLWSVLIFVPFNSNYLFILILLLIFTF